MDKVRLGLIGLGQMGKSHLRNCLHLKNARLIAVSDISEKSLLVAKNAGIKHISKDYNDLLKDSKIDAVIVSLPTFLHAEASIRAAEHGKHIFVEKPLARNIAEAERIVAAANLNGVKLMVGYPARFNSLFRKLKNELKLGTLGDVQIATADHISTGPFFHRGENSIPKPVPPWWFDSKLTGGGALIDLGCHTVNLFRWYFGEPAKVKSFLGYRFNMDFEDHATCTIEFKKGTLAIMNVGWFARYSQYQVSLYGTVKYASVTSQSPSALDYFKKMFQRVTEPSRYKELKHFVDCVNSNTSPSPSGQEGLEDIRLISTAYKHALHFQNNIPGDYE